MQWTQYTVDTVRSGHSTQWNSGIWWWGHCLWYKKVKPEDAVDAVCTGCSTQWNSGIWWWGHCLWCKKVKPVDAVDTVYSRCSKQWMQYTHSGCSGIMVYGGGDMVFGAKKVKPVDAVDGECSGHSGCNGIVVYGGMSAVYCIQCIHWFDLFAPNTMSPPPYTPLPLHPLCTAYCVHCIHWFLPFCIKDNVPTTIYHYSTASTAYCIHCVLNPLHPLVWPFCTKDNVPTTIYHYSTASTVSTASTAYCVHWFDLFAPKTMSPPPYTTIPLRPLDPLHTVSTGLTFLPQRQCPHHHIPLFQCVHCVLCPHHRVKLIFILCVLKISRDSGGVQ